MLKTLAGVRAGSIAALVFAAGFALASSASAAQLRSQGPGGDRGIGGLTTPEQQQLVIGTSCSGASMCNWFLAECIGDGGNWVPTKYNEQGQPIAGRCMG